ncbi:hypothetical protein K432DRAFT_260337, partial [Lepidopterella palustris CBS 459.81]
LATSATQVLATINAGTTSQYHVAWIYGDDPCGWEWVANIGDSLCANPFDPGNGYTYQFKFCGTDEFALYNGDGSFNSACEYVDTTYNCSPH